MSLVRRLTGGVACAALALTLGSLGACTDGGGTATPASPSTTLEPSGSPSGSATTVTPGTAGSLRVQAYGGPRRFAAYRSIVAAYTKLHPEVTIRLTRDPDAASAARTIRLQMTTGGGPDVFLLDQVDLPPFVRDGSLVPLDDLLEERGLQFGDDYARVALTTFSADNALQCMPAESSPYVVYFNADLLRRALSSLPGVTLPEEGGSWPWEDFAAAARAVAAIDGPTGPIEGIYVPPRLEMMSALVRSAGGTVVDDVLNPSSLTLAGEGARTAIAQVADLVRDPSVAPDAATVSHTEAVDLFTRGELGMLVGTRDDLPRLRAASGLDFDVMSLPSLGRFRSVTHSAGWCINAASHDIDPAADFIAFAVGPQGARIAARSGVIVPSNLTVLNSPVFTQPDEQPASSGAYFTSLRRSDVLPYSQAWPQVSALTNRRLARLFSRSDINLDTRLEPRMTRLDNRSAKVFARFQQADQG